MRINYKQYSKNPFGSSAEALIYPLLLLILLWTIFLCEKTIDFPFYKLGVLPRTWNGLIGIIFMPLIHSSTDNAHLINNSAPTYFLLSAIIYFYRDIALKVFIYCWLFTGILVWILAENEGSYHIGISGVIYAMASFLFTSGVLRKYLPLQAIALFVVFLYGSMIWGILPMEEKISWQGHLSGFGIGIILAFVYKEQGPVRPKYQYEIEKELGIEPPDLEGEWKRNLEELKAQEENTLPIAHQATHPTNYFIIPKQATIIYHYKPAKQQDDTAGQ